MENLQLNNTFAFSKALFDAGGTKNKIQIKQEWADCWDDDDHI